MISALSELSDASIGGEISPPKFTQLLRDVTTYAGQRVCLQCRVQGHPLPQVQWFRDNKPIESSMDYQVHFTFFCIKKYENCPPSTLQTAHVI